MIITLFQITRKMNSAGGKCDHISHHIDNLFSIEKNLIKRMIFDFFDVFDIRNFTPDLLFFVYQND